MSRGRRNKKKLYQAIALAGVLFVMVMIPVTRAVAISEHPFVAAFARTFSLNTGLLKCRRLFFRLNTIKPATAVTEYPSPVAMAAPEMPMPNPAINT